MAQKVVRPKKTSNSRTANPKGLSAKMALVQKAVEQITFPQFKSGDTVCVHVKIVEGDKERIQAYEGLCIGRQNHPGGKTFTVRKMSHGVGVERIFMENSPRIAKVDLVQVGRVRRAKLYYVRELEGKAAKIDRDMRGETKAETPSKK